MRPEQSAADWSRRARPADLPELMDGPCSYEEFRACVRDLGGLNRWTLGYRPTLAFLREIVSARPKGSPPLRVLDVGSGGGDGLRRIALWARRRRLAVRLTGIDLNPHATRAAMEFSAGDPRFGAIHAVQWLSGDALTEPAVQGSDVVLSALVTHHMEDAEIVAFLRWMDSHARCGWFINDLRRSRRASRAFVLLATLMSWHRFVRHDGPVSFQRAFQVSDWRALLGQAGVPIDAVRMTESVPGRLCLARFR